MKPPLHFLSIMLFSGCYSPKDCEQDERFLKCITCMATEKQENFSFNFGHQCHEFEKYLLDNNLIQTNKIALYVDFFLNSTSDEIDYFRLIQDINTHFFITSANWSQFLKRSKLNEDEKWKKFTDPLTQDGALMQ